MGKDKILKAVFLFFVLIALGYIASYKNLDPDFGWHFKTGELILKQGVPHQDWYSFTMPSFSWIDHEWLTDVLIYKIYSFFNLETVLLFFLTLSALAFIVLIKQKYFWYYFLPVLTGYLACLGFLGVRPQIITVLFIAIFWEALREYLNSDNKLIYFCPILFLVWANLHGGFAAGLFLFLLASILEFLKNSRFFEKLNSLKFFIHQESKKQSLSKIKILLLLFILSFLATLINPYGLRIYEEIFRTIGDSFLGFHIAEWLPLFFTGPLPVFTILYLSLFLGLFIIFYKKIDFTYSVILLIFLILALLHQRHFFIFIILSVPIFTELLFYLKRAINPTALKVLSTGSRRWIFFSILLIILVTAFYPILKGFFRENDSLIYPSQEAISFLKTLPLSENLLNEYDWGGYLIWKLPGRKFFIDGRMPSWRQDGKFIFGDYVKIMKADNNFQKLLEKYKIKVVLLKKKRKTEFLRKKKLEKTKKPCTLLKGLISCQGMREKISPFFLNHKKVSQLLGLQLAEKNIYGELVKQGWKTIYEGKTSIILRR